MTGRGELTFQEIEAPGAPDPLEAHVRELECWEERLAYLRELRALLHSNTPETPSDGQKKGSGPSKPAPVCDVDLQLPDQRQTTCPPLS
jgi:hypothetical protein